MKKICLCVVLTMLAGCATEAISPNKATFTPSDRIYYKNPDPSPSLATAFFIRDTGFLGSGVYVHLFIDGQKAASLDPGEKVQLYIAAGERIFGVIPTNIGNTNISSIDQNIKPGQVYFYRILTDANSFRTFIQRLPGTGE